MAATSLRRRVCVAAAFLVVLLAGGCVAPRPLGPVPPIPPGEARFWFYRVFFADDTFDMPAIAMNGRTVGYGLAGTSFYRDVPPGAYHLTVESVGTDLYQSQEIAVAPGQQIFVKIASLPSWEASSIGAYRRGTYYVMLVPPGLAARELPQATRTDGY